MVQSMKLLEYLPKFYHAFKELIELFGGIEPELHALDSEIRLAFDGRRIFTANAYWIARWEKILGLPSVGTLEERRFEVFLKYNDKIPYTLDTIKALCTAFYGEENFRIEPHFDEYYFVIYIRRGFDGAADVVDGKIRAIEPANIGHINDRLNNIWQDTLDHPVTFEDITWDRLMYDRFWE